MSLHTSHVPPAQGGTSLLTAGKKAWPLPQLSAHVCPAASCVMLWELKHFRHYFGDVAIFVRAYLIFKE